MSINFYFSLHGNLLLLILSFFLELCSGKLDSKFMISPEM